MLFHKFELMTKILWKFCKAWQKMLDKHLRLVFFPERRNGKPGKQNKAIAGLILRGFRPCVDMTTLIKSDLMRAGLTGWALPKTWQRDGLKTGDKWADETGGLVLFVHHFLPHNNVYLSGASGELDLWCKMTVIIWKFSRCSEPHFCPSSSNCQGGSVPVRDDPGDSLKAPCHRGGIWDCWRWSCYKSAR